MLHKFVETKRIKELVVKHPFGGLLWQCIKYGILGGYFLWSRCKLVCKTLGISCVTIYTDDPVQKKGCKKTTVLEKVVVKKKDQYPGIPLPIVSFLEKPVYDLAFYSLPGGKLMGQHTVSTAHNTILRWLSRYPYTGYGSNPRSYIFFPKKAIKKSGTAIVLTGNDTFQNLNHRLTCGFAKYYCYQQIGIIPDRYISDTQKTFHREGREALGIPREKILTPETASVYEFDQLIACTTPSIYSVMHPEIYSFIRTTFLTQKEYTPQKKIYLKRKGTRRILNEEAFDTYLLQQGYEIITTSPTKEESLDVELFAEATHVIAPHGAGLTKVVFCPSTTIVIELFHPETLFGHYFALCQSIGLSYYCFVGEQDKSYTGLAMDAPIKIDIEKFDKFYKEI